VNNRDRLKTQKGTRTSIFIHCVRSVLFGNHCVWISFAPFTAPKIVRTTSCTYWFECSQYFKACTDCSLTMKIMQPVMNTVTICLVVLAAFAEAAGTDSAGSALRGRVSLRSFMLAHVFQSSRRSLLTIYFVLFSTTDSPFTSSHSTLLVFFHLSCQLGSQRC